MSFTNYQSFQDLDQNEFYYEKNIQTPQIWCQKDNQSQTSTPQNLQTSTKSNGMTHIQQQLPQYQYQNYQDNKQVYKDNLNNQKETHSMINNQNSFNEYNKLSNDHTNQQQPCIHKKINAKLVSIEDLLAIKDEQCTYPYYDSGNDIFTDVQTRSNSFQSDNQSTSVSNTKKIINMTTSTNQQSVQEKKQNHSQCNGQTYQKMGFPNPSFKKSSENYVHPNQIYSITQQSYPYVYPSTVPDIREFKRQPQLIQENLDHNSKNIICSYKEDVEYFSNFQHQDKQFEREIQTEQNIHQEINNQNAFQDRKQEKSVQQVSLQNFSENYNQLYESKCDKNYQHDSDNGNSYKLLENTYSENKFDNFQYQTSQNQKQIEQIQNQEPISYSQVNDLYNNQYPDIQHSECQKQNYYGNSNQNTSYFHNSASLLASYKFDEDRDIQLPSQCTELNNRFEQNNNNYLEQNYYNTSHYPQYQYDPDTFFDYETNTENKQQDAQTTYHKVIDLFQQSEQISNSIIINQDHEKKIAYSNPKLNTNQIEVFEKFQEDNFTHFNDKNNASLTITTIQNVSQINQNPLFNLQSKSIRESDQELIQSNQIIPSIQVQSNVYCQFRQIGSPFQSFEIKQQQEQQTKQNNLIQNQSISPIQCDASIVQINYNKNTDGNEKFILQKRKSTQNYEKCQNEYESSSFCTNSKIDRSQSDVIIKQNSISSSPSIKKKSSSISLRLTPNKQLNENFIKKDSVEFSDYYEGDEVENELSLKFEQINLKKKISIDTQSFEDEGETIDKEEQDFKDSSDNCSLNQLIQLTQNKKNVVKNLMSAFKTFILSWGEKKAIEQIYNITNEDCEEIDDIQRKFKRYIDSKSFNHYSLRLLILHVNYGPIFKYFLSEHSIQWLEKSKIKDIESHQKMIKFFLSCFDDIKIIDNLRRHPKKKCRFS